MTEEIGDAIRENMVKLDHALTERQWLDARVHAGKLIMYLEDGCLLEYLEAVIDDINDGADYPGGKV